MVVQLFHIIAEGDKTSMQSTSYTNFFQNKFNRVPRLLLGIEVGVFKPDGVTLCSLADDNQDYFTAFVNLQYHQAWIDSIINPSDQRSSAIILCGFDLAAVYIFLLRSHFFV